MIYRSYQILVTDFSPDGPRHPYMAKWEQALGTDLPLKTWQFIWNQATKSSICTLYKENQYKILFHWYQTPDLLHSIYPIADSRCWRCYKDRGTLFHVYWTCPLIIPYWGMVQSLLQSIFDTGVLLDPRIFLLGLPPTTFSKASKKLLAHVLTAARCLVSLKWKKRETPSLTELHSRIRDVKRMEYLTASLNDTLEKHNRIWKPWVLFETPVT